MAYVLGFIFADGAIEDCRRSSRTCYIQLTNNNKDLLWEVRNVIQSNHRLYFRSPHSRKFGDKTYHCKGTYNLRVGSKVIYKDLLSYGLCPRKSLVIKLPVIPEMLFSFFLRGYFDGDGCVNVYKKRIRVIFTSGSKIFLEQVAEQINARGLIRCDRRCFRLIYDRALALNVLDIIYQDLNEVPYLKKKYNIYQDFLRTQFPLRPHLTPTVFLARIRPDEN